MSRVKISDPAEQLRAGTEAVEFLSSVGLDELRLCLFSESLPSFSEFGAELGAFTASVQLGYYEQDGRDQKCFLVHISSQSSAHDGPSRGSAHDGPRRGSAHEVPCGCSVTAFISQELETLEQHQHEYLQLRGNSLDKKTTMRRRGDRMEISRVITEGQDVRHDTKSYPLSALSGFISEASNLLVTRLLARRKGPGNLDFLTFDTEMNLCISSYRWLGSRPQLVGRDAVEVYGVERALLSDDVPITWQYYFLPDGHLANRVQVGSPVTIRILQMPMLSEPEEEDPKPQFVKKPLSWEEDVQLYPEFLERKVYSPHFILFSASEQHFTRGHSRSLIRRRMKPRTYQSQEGPGQVLILPPPGPLTHHPTTSIMYRTICTMLPPQSGNNPGSAKNDSLLSLCEVKGEVPW